MSTRGSVSTISLTWAMTTPSLKARGLDDRRRVLGVRSRIEIAVAVGADRGDQRDLRRQIDEIAGE